MIVAGISDPQGSGSAAGPADASAPASSPPLERVAELPFEIWRCVIDCLAHELACGPPLSSESLPTLKSLGATNRAFQELCHPLAYRSLTVTTKHLASSHDLGMPDIARYLLHAKRIFTTDDRDIFTRPRVYRLSSQYEQDCALVDKRFAQLLWRLADSLEEAAFVWFPAKSSDAAHALRQCGRLNFLSVTGDLPASLRAEEGTMYTWPLLKHARFFRCSLASAAHVLSAPRNDAQVEHLHLDRVNTGGEDDIFPPSLWHTLKTLELVDLGNLDLNDVLDSLRLFSLNHTPSLTRLAIDCSATDISSLHNILDSLACTPLRSLAIMSSPDQENPRARGGHLLFQHIATALPKLERLTFMRGNGYEVVPWIATLNGYAEALAPLQGLHYLTLNHSNGYHSPAGSGSACIFGRRIPSLRYISFRGKVSMSVGITYRLERNEEGVMAYEQT